MKHASILALVVLGAGWAGSAAAASESDYTAAFAAATSAESEAGKIQNQWTATEDTLRAAKKAADAKNFDQATDLAQLAKAMALRSIEQAKQQATAWRDAVVR